MTLRRSPKTKMRSFFLRNEKSLLSVNKLLVCSKYFGEGESIDKIYIDLGLSFLYDRPIFILIWIVIVGQTVELSKFSHFIFNYIKCGFLVSNLIV